jgi:hypothetical protein
MMTGQMTGLMTGQKLNYWAMRWHLHQMPPVIYNVEILFIYISINVFERWVDE